MASEIITLPGHLRVLFDNIYAGEPVSGNAWVVWQRVLQARIQEPALVKRNGRGVVCLAAARKGQPFRFGRPRLPSFTARCCLLDINFDSDLRTGKSLITGSSSRISHAAEARPAR